MKDRIKNTRAKRKNDFLTALVANTNGEIFELKGYGATGASYRQNHLLTKENTCEMPYGSEMMYLPDRVPVLYHIESKRFQSLSFNPYNKKERIFPVSAFNSPGYMITHTVAYEELPSSKLLPLFSYGALGFQNGSFRSACIQVDRERRQDLRLMKIEDVRKGIVEAGTALPFNRLRKHLETCALVYGCPAGKNFFLGRFEAPLPTATTCNARCLGCISLQKDETISSSQNRIQFIPTKEEIAEVALYHIGRVKNAIVSFGQGCEGDPLLSGGVINEAILLIREKTMMGTININTNGSLPGVLERLIDAGLDSVRISLNSVRKVCYDAYFRPKGYRFMDVLESIRLSLRRNIHVAINYLNCPGFTDSEEELKSLYEFLEKYPIHMIQWRNLNFDPVRYLSIMEKADSLGASCGMISMYNEIKARYPHLKHGYFNPGKSNFLNDR